MLIAAGEGFHRLRDGVRLDVDPTAVVLCRADLIILLEHATLRESAAETRESHVPFDVIDENKPIRLSVFRHVCDLLVNRTLYRRNGDLFSLLKDFPRRIDSVRVPEQAHCQLGATCAHESRESDNLTCPDVERDIFEALTRRFVLVVYRPILYLQYSIADRCMPLGVKIRQLAPDHALDDAILVDGGVLLTLNRLDGLAVANNGDVVRNARDFVELV